jgi:hypothetical protein
MRELPELVRARGGSEELAVEIEARLAAADFSFRRERALPRIMVRAGAEGVALEARLRRGAEWTREAKQALIERGYELTDAELGRVEAHATAQ